MTRRGSLAYYLAAWICGCVFTSDAVWLFSIYSVRGYSNQFAGVFGLLFLCFYGLMCGAVPALIWAFILRRLMKALNRRRTVEWIAAGAGLSTALVVGLGEWGLRFSNHGATPPLPIESLVCGPVGVMTADWWLAIPSGAATAYVLYRIDRAFAPAAQPATTDAIRQ